MVQSPAPTEPHLDTYSTFNIQLPWNRFTFTSSAQILPVNPEEPEKVERRTTIPVPCQESASPCSCSSCPHSYHHRPRQTTRTSLTINVNSHHQKERLHFCWWELTEEGDPPTTVQGSSICRCAQEVEKGEGCEGQPECGATEVLQQVAEQPPS